MLKINIFVIFVVLLNVLWTVQSNDDFLFPDDFEKRKKDIVTDFESRNNMAESDETTNIIIESRRFITMDCRKGYRKINGKCRPIKPRH